MLVYFEINLSLYNRTIGFPMTKGNLPSTAVFATFLPPFFDSKSRGKSNGKFNAVNGICRKRLVYGSKQ